MSIEIWNFTNLVHKNTHQMSIKSIIENGMMWRNTYKKSWFSTDFVV